MRATKRGVHVGTVVLNYKSIEDTLACVELILLSDYMSQRVVVVDNTEDVDEQRRLQELLPDVVEYISSGGNIGYAAGNNIAIRAFLAEGLDYVWVVNPDVRVERSTLGDLVETMQELGDPGVVGPRIISGGTPPTIMSDGANILWSRGGAVEHIRSGKNPLNNYQSAPIAVDYVTGACMLIDSRVLTQVGLIPEDYFLYYEEADFCLRLTAAGWSPTVDPRSKVVHLRRSTEGRVSISYLYYLVRNRGNFVRQFQGEEAVASAYADVWQTFITPWRERISKNHPGFLPIFDDVAELARSAGMSGELGKADLTPYFEAERELVG